jgi:5,6,7,8-tetrahydromethanopterin hydro-lyase
MEVEIGEGFVGPGPNLGHVNTVLGERQGPVGAAFAQALATPGAGHAPFVAIGRPGVAISPPTLFVNKAAIKDAAHGDMTWGPAQAGVAKGVALALEEGVIDPGRCKELVLIAAVWVNPEADDAQAVFANNAAATLDALRNGKLGRPLPEEFLLAGKQPFNPFFRSGDEES